MESFIIVFAVGLTLLLALVIGRLLNWRIPPMSRRIVEIVFLVGLLPLIVLLIGRLWRCIGTTRCCEVLRPWCVWRG
jgi:uncharacterized membrane protein